MNNYVTKFSNKFFIGGLLLIVSYCQVYSQTFQTNGTGFNSGGNIIRLTSAQSAASLQTGTAWAKTKIDLTQPFDMSFELFFGCDAGPNGGDGMTFTLQNDPRGLTAIGAGYGFLGIGGSPAEQIKPAVSIEFDTYDGTAGGGTNEIAADHNAIDLNGDVNIGQPFIDSNGVSKTVQAILGGRDLESCAQNSNNFFTIRIVWNPVTKELKLYQEGKLSLTYTNDIVATVFGGTNMVYWGFTAATGNASNEQWFAPVGSIIPWECSAATSCCLPFVVTPTSSSTICNNPITLSVAGTYTSYDWSNGSITPTTQISTPGTYTLSVLQKQGANSCPGSATFVITPTGPTAIISGDATLCNTVLTTPLSVALTGTAPWSLTYAIDGATQPIITGINTSPYIIQAHAPHVYTLVSVGDNSGCKSTASGSATVNLFSGVPVGHDASFVNPGTANLSVDNDGATYTWFAAPTGGTSLFTGTAFTTPVLNATTTYYVESSAVPPPIKKSVALLNKSKGTGNDVNDHVPGLPAAVCYLEFTANQNFNLDEITCLINASAATSTGNVKIYITPYSGSPAPYVGAETLVKDSINITVGAAGQKNIVMPLNYACTAGSTYHISYSASGSLQTEMYFQLLPLSGPGSYPLISNSELSITQYDPGRPGRYPGLFDWKISRPSPASLCGRTPVTAFPCSTGAVIGRDTTICAGNAVLPFTEITANTGGPYTYQWQSSLNNGTFTDITSATNKNYQSPSISSVIYFKRIDKSATCTIPSNTIKVNITSKANINSIIPILRDTLCVGEDLKLTASVNTTTNPSVNGGYYYSWRKVQAGLSTIVAPPSATLTTYPVSTKSATMADSGTYYLIVQDGPIATLCKDSAKVLIVINTPPVVAGVIGSDQEICFGSTAAKLIQTSAATGQTTSNVTPATNVPLYYKWYSALSATGGLTKLSSTTVDLTFAANTPAKTMYYVRKDSSKYCSSLATNIVKIRVNNKPILSASTIAPIVDDTLCLGQSFQLDAIGIDSITAGRASSNGGYRFTWKKVVKNVGPGFTTTIVGATGPFAKYPTVARASVETDSGTYWLVIQDGIGASATPNCNDSIQLKIVINKAPSVKAIIGSNQEICVGGAVSSLTQIQSSSGSYRTALNYKWYKSSDSISAVPTKLGTTTSGLTLTTGPATITFYVRTDSVAKCLSVKSNYVYILVRPAPAPGTIAADTIICKGGTIHLRGVTVPTGGKASYTYGWERSNTSSTAGFAPVAGADSFYVFNNSIIASQIGSGTYYFRRSVKDQLNCGIVYSTAVTVKITDGLVQSSNASNTLEVCFDATPTITAPAANATKATNPSALNYQWQIRNALGVFVNVPSGGTGLSYTILSPLKSDTTYRRISAAGITSCDSGIVVVALKVIPQPTVSIIEKDTLICESDSKTFTALVSGATHIQWLLNGDTIRGATKNTFNTNKAGNYSVRVTNTKCNATSLPVLLSVTPTPIANAGSDITIQEGSVGALNASGGGTYNWISPAPYLNSTTISNPNFIAKITTTYTLVVTEAGCPSKPDYITVFVVSPIKIPNVITVNGDGKNDTWEIDGIEGYPNVGVEIYNRWGGLVWKSQGYTKSWDGTNYRNGEVLPDGTYYYILNLQSQVYPNPFTGWIQIMK